jgi:hypothetical protein
MSAWQGYKVVLLGLAVPVAAVIVEIGQSGSTQLPPVTEQPTTLQPPATKPPTTAPPATIIPPVPAATDVPAPLPTQDEPVAHAIVPNTVGDPSASEGPDPENTPSDAGGSP